MARVRKSLPVPPVVINRDTKDYYGFKVTEDIDGNVTITALWSVPKSDGTFERVSIGVRATLVVDLPEFAVINNIIATASE